MSLDRIALVVDDDVSIRLLIARILKRWFFAVDLAKDGAEAIEKLASKHYDVVILDVMMPRIDGRGVVQYLEEHAPDVLKRTIVVTAFGPAALGQVCPPVGRFVTKPFNVDDLVREVTETLWCQGLSEAS
jgi:CheY-like chemotaxis protein